MVTTVTELQDIMRQHLLGTVMITTFNRFPMYADLVYHAGVLSTQRSVRVQLSYLERDFLQTEDGRNELADIILRSYREAVQGTKVYHERLAQQLGKTLELLDSKISELGVKHPDVEVGANDSV